jgi:carboxylate-amine ligase
LSNAVAVDKFGSRSPFRVGVEEELFLVDPDDHALACRTDELLERRRRFRQGRLVGEMCDGVIELVTPVCRTAGEAADRLRILRGAVAADGGPLPMGCGVHPTQPFGEVRHRRSHHYDAVRADTRAVLAQSAYCGLHVHVGMPDPEAAITAYNGMRRWAPLLHALGANSPFWHGRDSGLASCRTVRCHSVPRTGLPRAFRDWSDYSDTALELLRVSDADAVSAIWWDIRPHPGVGTLEIRLLDAQASVDDAEGLIALIHCLTYHETLTAAGSHPSKEVLDEATFRAIRDGLRATFSTGGPMRHVQDHAREALQVANAYAPQLGCADSLQHLERLLIEGNGADRQRRAYAGGGLPALLAHLVDETHRRPEQPYLGALGELAGGSAAGRAAAPRSPRVKGSSETGQGVGSRQPGTDDA